MEYVVDRTPREQDDLATFEDRVRRVAEATRRVLVDGEEKRT